MLLEVSIKNFAIIEQVSLNFETGMTILSGETGAGKSIIIDAMNLMLGARATTDVIRHGLLHCLRYHFAPHRGPHRGAGGRGV